MAKKEIEKEEELPVAPKAKAGPKMVKVHVPFLCHINGEPFHGIHEVTAEVAECLIETVQRRKAIELASLEGRIKNIVRAADGRVIIEDKGTVNGGKI